MVAAARRFVIAGQILLKALAHKASSLPHSSGTPHLKLDSSKHVWSTIITVHSQNAASARGVACLPFELMFCLPKRLMNVCGPVIVEASKSFLGSSASASMVHSKSRVDGWKILTLQDDLDLKPGSFKIQRGGSPRGHNGVRSVEGALGNRDFNRIRLGIGRPENKAEVASYVLEPLGRDEVQKIDWDEGTQRGGELVEQIWLDVMRIAQEHASNKPSTST
ncbi:BZ3500_MvSof-1268-A1-R1_Chr12-2g03883 [Microbotryum saponariae]|uniref:peptidyl-tRNA hydrolase n=1 Tax=Microbotryum saponariae TaxID=289078 RepID=A0A2X0LLA7_9BASI|nr:BZ3500_MvSof-1268-A1-R1_Chr12-2g03883 [Microbotryum saponariae]SCZ99803.1 BZ3501_MvSof-1269-A2-R1_Chr12-2g03505 [Microbotryum saponariae]SDA05221.1 BZ3501_MvSof-1269-A2-R1_Chr3-1g05701 [Microbotryum saponariae]